MLFFNSFFWGSKVLWKNLKANNENELFCRLNVIVKSLELKFRRRTFHFFFGKIPILERQLALNKLGVSTFLLFIFKIHQQFFVLPFFFQLR